MSTASEQAPAAIRRLTSGADSPMRARRKALGLSTTELAERVGLSASGLLTIENGNKRPSFERAAAIADALDSPVEDLFRLADCACGCGGRLVVQGDREPQFLSGHNVQLF